MNLPLPPRFRRLRAIRNDIKADGSGPAFRLLIGGGLTGRQTSSVAKARAASLGPRADTRHDRDGSRDEQPGVAGNHHENVRLAPGIP